MRIEMAHQSSKHVHDFQTPSFLHLYVIILANIIYQSPAFTFLQINNHSESNVKHRLHFWHQMHSLYTWGRKLDPAL